VLSQVRDRYDDQLAALPDGRWASATNLAVTWWSVDGPDGWVRASEAQPGPLAWLPDSGMLAWGPTVIRDGEVAWPVGPLVKAAVDDLSGDARRRYVLVAAAVSSDAKSVALILRHQLPRTIAARTPAAPGPESRVAIVESTSLTRRAIVREGAPIATALSWGGGPLIVGLVGQAIEVDESSLHPTARPLPSRTACRSVASGQDGQMAAGMADGQVIVWSTGVTPTGWAAHAGVVGAMSWAPEGGLLATGGADGVLRVWTGSAKKSAELSLGAVVEAVTWLDGQRLVAKSGPQPGRILVIGNDA
jgi:hypothetical protein